MADSKSVKNTIYFWLLWIIITIAGFYLLYDYVIKNTGFMPAQPIQFSHKVHSGDFGMKCLSCHTSAENSAYSEIPTTYSCMVCHIALKNTSDLIKPLNESFDSLKPIIWNRVYRVPDFAKFNHKVHINSLIDCSTCHGEVEKMEKVYQFRPITMSWCIDCHRYPEKYAIPARDISGIFSADINLDSLNLYKKKYYSIINPPYGMWLSDVYESEYLKNIVYPRVYSRGNENCSVCHH
ncbi:MAG: hypothetical protein N2319_08975 [Candidatus Kapabacteria bacterium]|nr:hypothetical protein [Candidatus Kapabacteria bacterium]